MADNEPIRVLHIVGRMDRGGIETMLMNLYRAIDREKVQFDFLAHYGREAAYNEEIRRLGGKIYEMPALKDEKCVYYWKLFSYILALFRFFRQHPEYRIIHGHMTNTAAIYLKIAQLCGVPCRIAHSHSTRSKPGFQGIVTNLLHKPIHRLATDLFACSEEAAAWICPSSRNSNRQVRVIPNAIDLKDYLVSDHIRNEVRQTLSIQNKTVIICVARFRPEKNQIFLADVLLSLRRKQPNAFLLFVGDGPSEELVRRKIQMLGLSDCAAFLGARPDVPQLLQAADAFVLPSLWEGMPMSVVEALAAGLHPVISDGIALSPELEPLVQKLALDASAEQWADALLNSVVQPRNDYSEYLRRARCDIRVTASNLEKFYLEKQERAGK